MPFRLNALKKQNYGRKKSICRGTKKTNQKIWCGRDSFMWIIEKMKK